MAYASVTNLQETANSSGIDYPVDTEWNLQRLSVEATPATVQLDIWTTTEEQAWLNLSETAFDFWDNAEDEVWNDL